MKPAPFRHHAPTTVDEAVDPMEDVHNTAEYRRDLVRSVVRCALEQAAA